MDFYQDDGLVLLKRFQRALYNKAFSSFDINFYQLWRGAPTILDQIIQFFHINFSRCKV